MSKNIFAGMLAAAVLSACAGGAQKSSDHIVCRNDTIIVNADSPILPKIQTDTAVLRPFSREFRTFGTVQAENGHFAEVHAPFDGRITTLHVTLGQHVNAGDVLFEMSSPSYMEGCKSYLQAKQNHDRAKAAYERKKSLMNDGIVSKRELEEAFTEAENARHDMEFAEASLKVYGTDPSKMKLGETMKIPAPISGEIAVANLTTGSYIKADNEASVTIADLGRVWVTAMVKERFIGSVQEGGMAEIITEAEPDRVFTGKIINIGNLVDEGTRSIRVVISCDNDERKLKHGMYVAVRFLNGDAMSLVLPSTAVFQGKERSFIYVCTEDGNTFVRRPVELGAANGDNTEICIRKGLAPGERFVTEGGLYLN